MYHNATRHFALFWLGYYKCVAVSLATVFPVVAVFIKLWLGWLWWFVILDSKKAVNVVVYDGKTVVVKSFG